MSKCFAILLLALLCTFCQCTSQHEADDEGRDYPSEEAFTLIDSCMSLMKSDPLRTHHMLDSLQVAGLMTKPRCDYYHAMVILSGEQQPDSALLLCDRLLDEGRFGDDRFLEEEICVLASDISSLKKLHIETLQYANRGIALCHGDKRMRSDEATLMARLGEAEQELGRITQAHETYTRAYQLLQDNATFGDFIAMISLQKKQVILCNKTQQYDQMIAICHEILDEVERFDRDPSFIQQRPSTMLESGPATHDFANFYRVQLYRHLARAYRLKVEQGFSADIQADTDSVNAYLDKWQNTEGSQSPNNLVAMLPEFHFTGRKAAFGRALKAAAELYSNDSLCVEYVEYLKFQAIHAESGQDDKASSSYLKRALAVSDSIRQHDMERKLAEQLSLNMVQEQQLARQDAEGQLKRHKLLNVLLSVILAVVLLAGAVIAFLINKNRRSEQIIVQTQQDLTESKEEIKELELQLEEAKLEKNGDTEKSLYERIERLMAEQELYLNPELDILQVAELACSSRSVVSACINNITGRSFRQWLSDYRLSLFAKKLKENPDDPIDIIVMRCGYKEQSTFRRQFKATYGMTPTEYRRQLVQGIAPESEDPNIPESEKPNS